MVIGVSVGESLGERSKGVCPPWVGSGWRRRSGAEAGLLCRVLWMKDLKGKWKRVRQITRLNDKTQFGRSDHNTVEYTPPMLTYSEKHDKAPRQLIHYDSPRHLSCTSNTILTCAEWIT